ncbi:MAG: hypothetical protein QM811_16890 [Pirellulales bacterium]
MSDLLPLGMECQLVRNTSIYATPSWSPISIVRDLTLDMESGEANADARANQEWGAVLATRKNASVTFDILNKKGDTHLAAIKNAYLNKTLLDMAVLDGPHDVEGSEGLRADWAILKFSRNEQQGEVVSYSVTMKPGYSVNLPDWLVTGERNPRRRFPGNAFSFHLGFHTMHTFVDSVGRHWTIAINIAAAKRVRNRVDVDLYKLVDGALTSLTDLLGDPIRLVDVIYVLCEEQATAQSISDEDFGRSLAGDVIDAAVDAFMAALIDFFPDRRTRETLTKVLATAKALRNQILDRALTTANAIDPATLLATLIDRSTNSSTNSAASSVSTPAP